MILNISWIRFHQVFLKTDKLVYVHELSEAWCFYSADGVITIKCLVQKSSEPEQNMAFVDRYLNNGNIIKVESVEEFPSVKLRLLQE